MSVHADECRTETFENKSFSYCREEGRMDGLMKSCASDRPARRSLRWQKDERDVDWKIFKRFWQMSRVKLCGKAKVESGTIASVCAGAFCHFCFDHKKCMRTHASRCMHSCLLNLYAGEEAETWALSPCTNTMYCGCFWLSSSDFHCSKPVKLTR